MKRISTYAMAALFAFGFAACNKDAAKGNDTPVTPSGSGNTYASLTVSQVGSLRAETNDPQRDETGLASEQGVTTIDVVGDVVQSFATKGAEGTAVKDLAAGNFAKIASENAYHTAAFLTTAGAKNFGVVLNHIPGVAVDAQIVSAVVGTPATMVADIEKFTTANKFPMTSAIKQNTIKDGVEPAQVAAGNNLFEYDVERIVAQGIVQKDAALEEKTKDNFGKVVATSLTFSAINGATSTYYTADKAGSRTYDAGTKLYTGFESRIHSLAFDKTANIKNENKELVRLGDVTPTGGAVLTNDMLGGYKAIAVKTADYKNTEETSKGIYFLENSTDKDQLKANLSTGFYRVAHAKVYGTFVPATVYKLADNVEAKFVAAPGSNIWWKKTTDSTGKETYSDRTIKVGAPATAGGETWVEGRVAYKLANGNSPVVKDDAFAEGTTFYIGEDGLAYSSKEAAQAYSYFKNQTFQHFYTYKDGKCGYRSAWNKLVDKNNKILNCDARRNNIYHLSIVGFRTIGMNYDPSDPNDPNLPKPGDNDPDENPDPKNPQPSLVVEEGYMATKATILPWNFVARKNTILG